jgi:hypothetical protein
MLKGLDWFSAIIYAAVIYILAMYIAKALLGAEFNPLAIASSVFLLLALPVLRKHAGRPKPVRKK